MMLFICFSRISLNTSRREWMLLFILINSYYLNNDYNEECLNYNKSYNRGDVIVDNSFFLSDGSIFF